MGKFNEALANMTPAQRQGLISAGLGILASPSYGNFGQQVGKGGLIGMQGYNEAQRIGLLSDQQKSADEYRKALIMQASQKAQAEAAAEQKRLQDLQGGQTSQAIPPEVPQALPSADPMLPYQGFSNVDTQKSKTFDPTANNIGLKPPSGFDLTAPAQRRVMAPGVGYEGMPPQIQGINRQQSPQAIPMQPQSMTIPQNPATLQGNVIKYGSDKTNHTIPENEINRTVIDAQRYLDEIDMEGVQSRPGYYNDGMKMPGLAEEAPFPKPAKSVVSDILPPAVHAQQQDLSGQLRAKITERQREANRLGALGLTKESDNVLKQVTSLQSTLAALEPDKDKDTWKAGINDKGDREFFRITESGEFNGWTGVDAPDTRSNVSTTVKLPAEESEFVKYNQREESAKLTKMEGRGYTSWSSNNALDRFVNQSDTAAGGMLAPVLTQAQRFFASFGPEFENLKSADAMTSALNGLMATKFEELGARGLTDPDVRVLFEHFPYIATSKESRVLVAKTLQKSNDYVIRQYDEKLRWIKSSDGYPKSKQQEPSWLKSWRMKAVPENLFYDGVTQEVWDKMDGPTRKAMKAGQ